MNNFLTHFTNNPHIFDFLAYSATFLAYGSVITSLGPYIPYLSAQSGLLQTEYSFLFFCRASGYLLGGIILKKIEKYLKLHTIIVASSLIIMLTMTLFSFSTNMKMQGGLILTYSILSCFLEVVVNVCVLRKHRNNQQQFWLQLNHGIFGLGGIIGPLYVYLFQKQAFTAVGVVVGASSIVYLWIKSPQFDSNQENTSKGIKKPQNAQLAIQRTLCFLFFMYIGLQSSYGGWISSYGVLSGVSSKQEATSFGSVFWISMTTFRFLSACVAGRTSVKLKFLYMASIVICLLSFVFILGFNWVKFAIYLSAVGFGATFAAMFPLLLTLPTQFGLCLSNSQNANVIIFSALGQGFLSMMVGYIMEMISINALFFSIVIFLIVMRLMHNFIILKLQQQSNKMSKQSIEMHEVLLKPVSK